MSVIPFPSDDMIWGTAATESATTWPHIDDHGMATIIKVMTGSKYWVMMRPKQNRPKEDTNGNMNTIHAFGEGWSPHSSCHTLWDHEGVLLRAGDILYVIFFDKYTSYMYVTIQVHAPEHCALCAHSK
jgi:hypothetical protein